jgi:hypothetical protein
MTSMVLGDSTLESLIPSVDAPIVDWSLMLSRFHFQTNLSKRFKYIIGNP